MADFDTAINLVLKHEGGYVNNPDDPGGETNFGISKAVYPSLDIKSLTIEEAKQIYLRDYWKPYMEQEPNQLLANCALDCAVNMGSGVAHSLYLAHPSLREFQVARLMHYTAIPKPQFYHSWFSRTLDV
jgi:lysozyme family protein